MSSYNNHNSSNYGRNNNRERYIPRERDVDDRREEEPRREEPRRDDRRREDPRHDDRRREEEPRRDDRRREEEPRRDDRRREEEPRREDTCKERAHGQSVDLRSENPSICIPRTFVTIRGEQTKRAVFRTFKDLRIGHIERIDTVHKTDKHGEKFCTVYVHLVWNMQNQLARDTRAKLLGGEEIKIVYDEPWFWKCTMSAVDKPANRYSDGPHHHTTSRPRIDLGERTTAISRYTQDREEEEHNAHNEHEQGEQHNSKQLCNMGDNEEHDEDE